MRIETDIVKTASVVGLLCAVYGGVVLWPSGKQNKALAATIQDKQDKLDAYQLPDLDPLRSEIFELRTELRERPDSLPVGDLHDRVLHHVSNTLIYHGITEYDTSYRQPQRYARFAVTPIDVQFSGGFVQAFDVIRRIEQEDPGVRIERLEISGQPDNTSGYVTVNLQMSSFYLPRQREGGRR